MIRNRESEQLVSDDEHLKYKDIPLRRPERTYDGRIYTVYINDDDGRYRVAYTGSTYPEAIRWVINNCPGEQWTIFEERRISGSKQIKTAGV